MYSQATDEPSLRGFDKVRVKKDALIEILTENRKEHRKIFEEAIDSWHSQVKKRLAEMVKAAKEGPDKVVLMVGLPKPEDHTKSYDMAIRMLELSLDDELELSDQEFSQYVMDEWGWQRQFLATTSNYSSTAQDKQQRMS